MLIATFSSNISPESNFKHTDRYLTIAVQQYSAQFTTLEEVNVIIAYGKLELTVVLNDLKVAVLI